MLRFKRKPRLNICFEFSWPALLFVAFMANGQSQHPTQHLQRLPWELPSSPGLMDKPLEGTMWGAKAFTPDIAPQVKRIKERLHATAQWWQWDRRGSRLLVIPPGTGRTFVRGRTFRETPLFSGCIGITSGPTFPGHGGAHSFLPSSPLSSPVP